MCKVLVRDPEKKAELIMYNHLYQREEREFTLTEMSREMKNLYHLDYSEENVKALLKPFIENGSVYQKVGQYVYAGNMF